MVEEESTVHVASSASLPRAVKDLIQSEIANALGNIIALCHCTIIHSQVSKQYVENCSRVNKRWDAAVGNYRR